MKADRVRSAARLALVCACIGGCKSAVAGAEAQQHNASAGPAGANPAIAMCKASDLSLGTDAENGALNGMSHSGTLLVLRNLSSAPCRVPHRPEIHFMDGTVPIDVKLEIPGARFMHPGPVLVPVVIAPDAEATSKLRWVSGEVYADSVCVSPTAIAVRIGRAMLQAALGAHICGDKSKGVTFEATPLAIDPVYEAGKMPVR